jgi:outer membrane protein OmpA-like peptidoglycan-associated protein
MPRTWTLPDNDSLNVPIRIELTVEDSTGATASAADEIPVVVDRQVRLIETQGEEQADRTSYALVAFGYNSAEPNPGQLANLASIAAGIAPGTNVTITGYTDRIGSEGSNIELSKRRADRVAQVLRDDLALKGIEGVRVISEAGGVDTERFGNNTPEGRILSRGVLVVIEHPRGE